MKLLVRVIEARNIPAMDLNGFSDPYVRLQLGKYRFRTKVVKKSLSPHWGEEFIVRVEDMDEELQISVLDEDKYFNDDFVGHLKVPISRVFDADNKSLGTAWHTLHPKNKKAKIKECGEILLTIQFCLNSSPLESIGYADSAFPSKKITELMVDSPRRSFTASSSSDSPARAGETASTREDKSCAQKTLAGRIAQIFNKNPDSGPSTPSAATTASIGRGIDLQDLPATTKSEICENKSEDQLASGTFEEVMKIMESRDQESESPGNLTGGVLLDQMYAAAPADLNSVLFSPYSTFPTSLAEEQGTTELQIEPWKFENVGGNLKRVVTYIKAATKLLKATKATEEQTYTKADGKVFVVSVSVSTPDVMYGSTFKVELQYCVTPGPELPSGEQSSHLVISWQMNFLQSTMMRGMIENGARQGLRDSFGQYASVLSRIVKQLDLKDIGSDKEQMLASLQAEPQSDLRLGVQYFANFTVVSTLFIGLYVLVHIWMAMPSTLQGLEFVGLDLPDSIGEVVVCGILVLQAERVLEFISRFMQARAQKGSDHGVKARGDGWLLTIALIEGSNLAAVDSSGYSDPYVVFTCNGKTRTSSIKFQTLDPQWNEIFEFDAMEDPPSVVDVEVYDFDGPFDNATSLGHAEINFLKTNIAELADVWVPLHGKLAQACQSKLHLRIFLNNTNGSNAAKEYLSKMEKEVGKKMNLRSPQTNSTFQKLFGLPPEEFLINDFTCHLKRKLLLQGRLFLSARIIGFYTNMFGSKTKFFFLWVDIEDIQVLPPTLASMGSPTIVMTLRKGKGMDARHGARTQDTEGRLKFYFHSFVYFNNAHRTIMALWKPSLSPEQKVLLAEEESDAKSLQTDYEFAAGSLRTDEDCDAKGLQSEESGSFLVLDDGNVTMSEVYSSDFPIPVNFFIKLFGGGELDCKVMEKAGCLNYSHTPWETEKADLCQRQICYRLDKRISGYRGEVTSTQQRSPLSDKNGWLFEEIMSFHGVPLDDYFSLHLRYQIEDLPSNAKGCHIRVLFGVAWLKSTRHQKRITRNILRNLQSRLKLTFSVVEREYAMSKPGRAQQN